MQISHVIRGEEWLPSLALHILLYRAFNWEAPEFAHLPLILKPAGTGKLSKRDGDKLGFPVFPLEWKDPSTGDVSRGYKEDGYFSEAVINFLALLGWNPGTEQEIFNLEELVNAFDLDRVNKSGARFDPEKIKWFNHHYLQTKSSHELAKLFNPTNDKAYAEKVISLIKERATFVSDFWELGSFFFEPPKEYDVKAAGKQWKENTSELMQELISVLEKINDFSTENTETTVKQWITNKNLSFGQIMPPLRLALVGEMKGPHVFDIISLIGKKETISRIQKAAKDL
jgi:glutamyl-tRNA synthetase